MLVIRDAGPASSGAGQVGQTPEAEMTRVFAPAVMGFCRLTVSFGAAAKKGA